MNIRPIPVVFRYDGDVFALFPTLPADLSGHCDCFQHVGQHCGADYQGCIRRSRPATPAEYKALKRELESYPYRYNLRVVQRAARGAHAARLAIARS